MKIIPLEYHEAGQQSSYRPTHPAGSHAPTVKMRSRVWAIGDRLVAKSFYLYSHAAKAGLVEKRTGRC
jgi:hypothetical protein